MRVWIKTLIGISIALLMGLLIPLDWSWAIHFFNLTSNFFITIGRYILFPLIFFSLVVRSFELHRENRLGKTVFFTSILIASTTLIYSIIGVLFSFTISGIPIDRLHQEETLNIPTFQEFITSIFPPNLFSIFITDGTFLIPIVIFALFLGWNMVFDKTTTRPIADLFDSLAKVFKHMNIFFVDISGIGFIFILTTSLIQLRQIKSDGNLDLFSSLIIELSIITLFLIFAIYPLVLVLFGKTKNPYKILFGMLTPSVAAFISGNIYYSIPMTLRHNEKNLGIKQDLNTTVSSLVAIAGRGGTAFVTATAVILLMKSYHSVAYIGFIKILLVILLSFSVSFFTGSFHHRNVLVSVALVFQILQTKENEYLNLIAIAPILYCFAALIDSINNTVITYICGQKLDENKEISVKNYI